MQQLTTECGETRGHSLESSTDRPWARENQGKVQQQQRPGPDMLRGRVDSGVSEVEHLGCVLQEGGSGDRGYTRNSRDQLHFRWNKME